MTRKNIYKQLKKHGVMVYARGRLVNAPANCFENIPVPARYYVGQLIKQKFKVQYQLF